MSTRYLAVTLVLLGFCSNAFAQKKDADLPDTIVKTDGKTIKCEIVREESKKVLYKDARGKDQEIASADVTRIEFKDFPPELIGAEAAVEGRNFSRGDSLSEEACKATSDGRAKELFGCRARVARARALRAVNRAKDAAGVAEEGITMGGSSKWAALAHIERVAALAESGSDDCLKAGEEAESKADQFDEEFKYDVLLIQGDYYCDVKKDASKAKEKYAFVQNSRRPELQEDAQLGLARVKLLEKNLEGAEGQFRTIAAIARSANALCGACLGLDDSVMLKAEKGGSKPDLYREALSFYLRGAVLAAPSGGQRSENHETCIVRAGETAEKIAGTIPEDKKNERNLAAKKFFTDYARKIFEDAVRAYPASPKADDYKKKVQDLKSKSIALQPASEKKDDDKKD